MQKYGKRFDDMHQPEVSLIEISERTARIQHETNVLIEEIKLQINSLKELVPCGKSN